MKTTIETLIEQYNVVDSEAEKRLIKNLIHLQYYGASGAERKAIQEIMQPFLDEIEQEMIEKDPIARQTYEMFKRLETKKEIVGH